MTQEEALRSLVWSWRSPSPEVLALATSNQAAHELTVNDADGLSGLLEAQPHPARADDMQLYVVRDGKPHYATGHHLDEPYDIPKAARSWEMLHAEPGDTLYAVLYGWTRGDMKIVHWALRINLKEA